VKNVKDLKSLPLLLALMLAIWAFSSITMNANADGEAILSIVPSENTFNYFETAVNSTFAVNATVTDVINLWNWQVRVIFDTTVLNCVDAVIPDDSPFNFEIDSPVIIENTQGYVQLGSSRLGTTPGVNGSGVLTTITFKIISAPSTPGETLSSYINYSRPYDEDTYLNDPDMLLIPATLEDATFEYTWPEVNRLIHSINVDEETYMVVTESNCSLTPVPMIFNQTAKSLYFNLSGTAGNFGYVNVTIPKDFMWGDFTVTVDAMDIEPQISANDTHTFLYFTVEFSSVVPVTITATDVVPEFSLGTIMLTLLLAATIAVLAAYSWKSKKFC